MKQIVKSIVKPVVSYGSQKAALFKLGQLDKSLIFVEPLFKTLCDEVSNVEKNSILQIERRRKELLNSKKTFEFIDFGTGFKGDGGATVKVEKPVSSAASWSRSPFWSLFLFHLVRRLNPKVCLEMGSCVGISGSYMASALSLNERDGVLTTLEGCEDLALITSQTFERLKLNNAKVVSGTFDKTLDQALSGQGPFDFAYVDGNHSYEATVNYHKKLKAQANGQPLTLVFDDIHWSAGMKKAWSEIYNDQDVKISLDLRGFGLCFINFKEKKQHYNIPIV